MQTRAPKLAVSDSSVISTALIGSTTDPNSRNSTMSIAPMTVMSMYGSCSSIEWRKSYEPAAMPPTRRRDALAGGHRADDRDLGGGRGLCRRDTG